MVKLTIVGRASDGLPLAQSPRYSNEGNEGMMFYKRREEFILEEISRGALTHTKMSIRIDHHCINYMIENGLCYITLCESSYPRKLAFHYLHDLHKEMEKIDLKLLETISEPYSFVKFDYVIGTIRKQYLDTRTQANLSRLNANRRQDLDIVTEDISKIIENKQRSELLEKALLATRKVSPIWCSPQLEVIALKWTPITLISMVAAVLFWATFIITDY